MSDDYTPDMIQQLEGIEHVRERPSMYIGDVQSGGLHHLIYEVLDNSIDEAMAGHGKRISVEITAENTIRVVDEGRGIPVGINAKAGISGVELAMTSLFAGGKFEKDAYKTSGGLHGVGVSCVNALSEWCEVEVARNGQLHRQRYERGVATTTLDVVGEASATGTTTHFKPDPDIFKVLVFEWDIVAARVQELAFLNAGVEIVLIDRRADDEHPEGRRQSYCYEGGIRSFVEHLNRGKDVLHGQVIYVANEDTETQCEVEVAFQYNTGYQEQIRTFVNNINTRNGGTHLSGFKSALSRTLKTYALAEKLLKEKDPSPTGDDWREGMSAVLSVKIAEPQFEGQTKGKLGNSEVAGQVEKACNEALKTYLEEHPDEAKIIVQKGVQAAQAREAARKARDLARRSSPLSSGGMPDKLTDCRSRNIDETEIFLVEGDSAAGTAKSGRDSHIQAILPLRGKILNVEKARIDKMMGHSEINTIIQALGTGIGAEFDIEKLRYGKVIIMCDADVDGSHIRTLLLTFFYRHMKPLVDEGKIFVAQPPLYKLTKGKSKKGRYILTDREMDQELLSLGISGRGLKVGDRELDEAALDALVQRLARIEALQAELLGRSPIDLDEALAAFDPEAGLPSIELRRRASEDAPASSEVFADEAACEARIEELKAADEAFVLYDGEDPYGVEARAPGAYERLRHQAMASLSEELTALAADGLDPASLLRPVEGAAPLVLLGSKGDEHDAISHLGALLPTVRKESSKGLDIQRYKGLGEMNKDELWETTMDPAARSLVKLKVTNEQQSDRMFDVLMGSDVKARREFIEENALQVGELDI